MGGTADHGYRAALDYEIAWHCDYWASSERWSITASAYLRDDHHRRNLIDLGLKVAFDLSQDNEFSLCRLRVVMDECG